MTLVIELSEDQEKRLREAAEPLGGAADDLVKAALNDLLGQPAGDFEAAAKRVLEKNHELYERLAQMRYVTLAEAIELHARE